MFPKGIVMKPTVKILLAFGCLLILNACSRGESASTTPGQPLQVVPAPSKRVATMAEWTEALRGTYTEKYIEDEGNGVIQSMAVFQKKRFTQATRDGFRQLRIFAISDMLPRHTFTSVKTFVSVPDGGLPVLFLVPCVWSRGPPLEIISVAIMINGAVVLSRDFRPGRVERQQSGAGIAEYYQFPPTKQEIEALRQIDSASTVLVRISGNRGHTGLKGKGKHDQDTTTNFKKSIQDALYIYDTINRALEHHLPPGQEILTNPTTPEL